MPVKLYPPDDDGPLLAITLGAAGDTSPPVTDWVVNEGVTQKMLDAGTNALLECDMEYDSSEKICARVYVAMRDAQ